MLKNRIIPCLLLSGNCLVKTVKFRNPHYIGDPVNTVNIFNELEVDELIFLDIVPPREMTGPDFEILSGIAKECFMPLAYGGGVRTIEDAKKILNIGFEKIAVNTICHENLEFVRELSEHFGSQCVIASIDVKKNIWGKYEVLTAAGTKKTKRQPVAWAQTLAREGAGEILLTSIDLDGTWEGYDIDLVRQVSTAVDIPVIACGGAGRLADFSLLFEKTDASAAAAGSLFVYQKKGLGVLINYPSRQQLDELLP